VKQQRRHLRTLTLPHTTTDSENNQESKLMKLDTSSQQPNNEAETIHNAAAGQTAVMQKQLSKTLHHATSLEKTDGTSQIVWRKLTGTNMCCSHHA